MSSLRTILGSPALQDMKGVFPVVCRHRTILADADCSSGVACLIATKRNLYLLKDRKLTQLLTGEFYGLSQRGGYWYVFQKLGTWGRLLRFELGGLPVTRARRIALKLPVACHQIDFVGDELYVTHTYDNRLMVLRVDGTNAEILRESYPAGRLSHGRKSDNYAHMNSIWCSPKGALAVFHNETSKTGRNSEIVSLDSDGEIITRRTTQASHAHNVIELQGEPLYCDSKNGALRWGDKIVFQSELFTRGLAITRDHILLGGSAYGARGDRVKLDGMLFVLNHSFTLLAKVPIPAMVQEVRGLGHDLGLSNQSTVPSSWQPVPAATATDPS